MLRGALHDVLFQQNAPQLLAVANLRVIADVQAVVQAAEGSVGAHDAILHHGRSQLAVRADNRVADDGIAHDGAVADGHVGADDGVPDLAVAADADGRDDDGVGKLGVLAGLQKLGAVEQAGVGLDLRPQSNQLSTEVVVISSPSRIRSMSASVS